MGLICGQSNELDLREKIDTAEDEQNIIVPVLPEIKRKSSRPDEQGNNTQTFSGTFESLSNI